MIAGGQHIIKRVSRRAEYRFWCLGDIHWGHAGCHEKEVKRTIARIEEDPRAYWWGMGDYWDLVTWGDKRFDPAGISKEHRGAHFQGLAREMIDFGYELFKPIRKKCLGLLEGNHEWKYNVVIRGGDAPMAQDLSNALSTKSHPVPFLGYSAFKDIVFADIIKVRWYIHHGAGSAQTKGGKLNRLLRFVNSRDADIIAMGHVHAILDDIKPVLAADAKCEEITALNKLSLLTGSYLKGFDHDESGSSSYVERAGFDPCAIGSPCVVYCPGLETVAVEKPVGRLGRPV